MNFDFVFVLKKIVNSAASPLVCSLVLLAAGLLLAALKKRRAAWWLVVAGFLVLALFSFDIIPNWLVTPLEYRYPPLLDTDGLEEVEWVVVLGGDHRPWPGLPLTSQMPGATLIRLVEGIRLHRIIPGSRLVLSGGGVFYEQANAELMAEMAVALGVEPGEIVLEKDSRDTATQVRALETMLGREEFVLVTSASHMPRAMFLFRQAGMNPVPAPVGHLTAETRGWDVFRLFPASGHIRKAETAFREHLGLVWEKRGAKKLGGTPQAVGDD